MISIVGASHPGRRKHNEDSFTADADAGLGLVADGMGGYACGEVASALVKLTVEEAVANSERLAEGIARAHSQVKEAALQDPAKQGMGTTVIAVKVHPSGYDLAWVGDSRAYLWDGHLVEKPALKQITRDHSYVESLLASGAIDYQQSLQHPNRNLITQAIGIDNAEGLTIEEISGSLSPGQQLLLCSDGLVDELQDGEIASILNSASNATEALQNLLEAAVEAGGHDNITVVIVSADSRKDVTTAHIEPEVYRITYPGGETMLADALDSDAEFGLGQSAAVNAISGDKKLMQTAVHTQKMSPLKASFQQRRSLIIGAVAAIFVLSGLTIYLS